MKKSAYVIGGVLLGFVLATTTSAFADTVKSLIGKKVTGEYTVVVNGQKIQDKGAVIDGRANVPVRGISDALGADITVSGKTITVTTTDTVSSSSTNEGSATVSNKYLGQSKASLEESLNIYKERILKPAEEGKKVILADIELLKGLGGGEALIKKEEILKEYEESIIKAKAEVALIEEALAAIK